MGGWSHTGDLIRWVRVSRRWKPGSLMSEKRLTNKGKWTLSCLIRLGGLDVQTYVFQYVEFMSKCRCKCVLHTYTHTHTHTHTLFNPIHWWSWRTLTLSVAKRISSTQILPFKHHSLLKGTGRLWRNGWIQDWNRESSRWTWHIWWSQQARKCLKNHGDPSFKTHKLACRS